MTNGSPSLWGIVLAGGEGERSRGFVRSRLRSDAPKQFCTFFGDRSMVEHTLHRAKMVIPPERLLVVILDRHRPYASASLAQHPSESIIVQPAARGTGPAILLPLLHILHRDPHAVVATFPTDHFIAPETQFMAAVAEAAECLSTMHQDTVVLLGVNPCDAETDYGWIEPGAVVMKTRLSALHRIQRFYEKPSPPLAASLLAGDALWNTLVLVARASALLGMIQNTLPDAAKFVAPIRTVIGTAREAEVIEEVYRIMPAMDFSNAVLTQAPGNALVFPVRDVFWSDLGRSERVLATLARLPASVSGYAHAKIRNTIPEEISTRRP